MALSLFEFMTAMFDRQKYARCTDADKKQHFFMVQRCVSTLYPVEANNFNVIGINQTAVVDYWHFVLSSKYKRQPKEIFTPTKKSDTEKSKISAFKKEVVLIYLRVNKLDERDFDFLASINEDFVCSELKSIESDLKESPDYFLAF